MVRVSGTNEDRGDVDGAGKDARAQMSDTIQNRSGWTARISVMCKGRAVRRAPSRDRAHQPERPEENQGTGARFGLEGAEWSAVSIIVDARVRLQSPMMHQTQEGQA